MPDLPILFSPPMVRALVREVEQPGTGKTQTRRTNGVPLIERTQSEGWLIHNSHGGVFTWSDDAVSNIAAEMLPFQPGDRLWCREEHFQFGHWEVAAVKTTKGGREKWQFVPDTDEVLLDPPAEFRKGRHNADPGTPAWHKRLGRFMFRKHSRLTLYVTDVRVERLQDISEEDARAEGAYIGKASRRVADDHMTMAVAGTWFSTARAWYADLWKRINGDGAWDANPWVAAYTFVPRLGNIDTLPATLADLPSHDEGSRP
ncbi:ASCH domain-containing protein [Xanthobacter aminoxidans]|uniref:hypothetical protein n=1 Tax=Xanthobacter aminoxidans TaxID=186280 RepID=UPI00202314B7|nr:hypothetical protein [Xanthobacter aminoxidans]MCL8382118.1 hypothetical protein [Xanthobacter aminoxidans]